MFNIKLTDVKPLNNQLLEITFSNNEKNTMMLNNYMMNLKIIKYLITTIYSI